jgi:hypothetical protein
MRDSTTAPNYVPFFKSIDPFSLTMGVMLVLPFKIKLMESVVQRLFYNKTSFLVQIKFITEDSKWFIYKY